MQLHDLSKHSGISRGTEALLRDGYLIIENAMPDERLHRTRRELEPHFSAARFGHGPFYGPETKRFGGVFARSEAAQQLALDEHILGIVEQVLRPNCDAFQINLTQAIEIHPGAPAQGPHRDQDMWWLPRGQMDCMVNVMWALDDFTHDNGATRVWPESNRTDLDCAVLPDDRAIPAIMPKGSACLLLGSTMHSGGANFSSAPRRGLVVSYCLGWLKPLENQWLVYPPEVARQFPAELAALVGYRLHHPSMGNVEGQCPSVLLGGPGGVGQSWTDTLMPQQAAMADMYRQMQLQLRKAA